MRITAIDTYIAGNPWKNWLFAKVSTDEGIHGVGEGTLNYFGKTIEAAIHELTPLVLGMDPFQVEVISQRLIRDVYSEGAQIHMCAVAAIEIACWDIIGKATNQPIYNLWAADATKSFELTPTVGIEDRARRSLLPRRPKSSQAAVTLR